MKEKLIFIVLDMIIMGTFVGIMLFFNWAVSGISEGYIAHGQADPTKIVKVIGDISIIMIGVGFTKLYHSMFCEGDDKSS